MRRLVVAIITALLAVGVTGCGGSTTSTAPPPAPAELTPAPPVEAVKPTDVSPLEPQAFKPFPSEESILPTSVATPLKAKKPFILFYYDSDQPASDDQSKQIDSVLKKYRDLVTLVSFDIGKYVETSETGTITVDPKVITDETASDAVNLSTLLGVKFTPYIIIVDSQGYETFRSRGVTDDKTIEREVLRVGE